VAVTLVEAAPTLGGRVRAWPVAADGTSTTMSRGFHAFFRQYYNLRSLLRRSDPTMARLRPVADYPLVLAGGHTDSFAGLPTRPPLNLMAFVARSPSFTLRDLTRVDVDAALGLLDVAFPRTYDDYAGRSAAEVLDELRFPDGARHLALEVFARSFFADPRDFSGGELVAMFHTYFLGSAEGLLFDVPYDDYDTALWAPLGRYLDDLGVRVVMPMAATSLEDRGGALAVWLEDGSAVEADAVVLATDQTPLQRLVSDSPWLGDEAWRMRLASRRPAPAFAVWRLWFDRPMREGTPPFLATSGFGPLDNVSAVHQFEAGAGRWARAGTAASSRCTPTRCRTGPTRPHSGSSCATGCGTCIPSSTRRTSSTRSGWSAPTARWSGPSRGGSGPRSARRTRGSRWRATGSAATSRSP
jgi:isorenieratene synthase